MTRVALKTQSRKWRPGGAMPPALAGAHPLSGQIIDMKHLTAHGSFKSVPTPNRPVSRRGGWFRQTPPRTSNRVLRPEAGTVAQLRSKPTAYAYRWTSTHGLPLAPVAHSAGRFVHR